MTRGSSSVKEQTACRRFLQALSPHLIAQPLDQGNDFGTDYLMKVFSDDGEYLRRFNVQVKYASPTSVARASARRRSPWDLATWLPNGELRTCSFVLSLEHYRRYTLPAISGGQPTLVYVANEAECFYFWIQDADAYLLRWLPAARRGSRSVSLLLSNARATYQTEVGHLLTPGKPRYGSGTETHFLHTVGFDTQPIGAHSAPDTVDSVNNFALSIYLQHPSLGMLERKRFAVGPFWEHLRARCREGEWRMLAFARVLGVLRPTEPMTKWALGTCEAWSDELLLPAALRILSSSPESPAVRAAVETCARRIHEGTVYIEWLMMMRDRMKRSHFDDAPLSTARREEELAAGLVWLLVQRVRLSKCGTAQAALVELVRRTLFPSACNWLVLAGLLELVRGRALRSDESLRVLKRLCGVREGDALTPAAVERLVDK